MPRSRWLARRAGAIGVLALLGVAMAVRDPRLPRGLPVTRTIDLNAATADQFELLPGVGPSLAAAIVADRQDRGPFGSVEDLDRVRGVGPALMARVRPHVALSPAAAYAAR